MFLLFYLSLLAFLLHFHEKMQCKYCFAWDMTFGFRFVFSCSNTIFVYIQIHLRQFHGTRYAAISPAMLRAEELEVQKSNQDLDDKQWYISYQFQSHFSWMHYLTGYFSNLLWRLCNSNQQHFFFFKSKQYFDNKLFANLTKTLHIAPCLMWNDGRVVSLKCLQFI